MKKILNNLPITTLVVVYFFVCGGLYLIGFWTTFNIDVTSFIALTDIPKSFVFPLVLGAGFTIVNTLLSSITASYRKDSIEEFVVDDIPKTRVRRFFRRLLSLDTLLLLIFLVAFVFLTFDKRNGLFWIFFGLSVGTLLIFKFIESPIVKKYLPSYSLRLHISHVVILIPVVCFVIGKGFSLRIFNNEKPLMYEDSRSKIDQEDAEKLKLIGFIGDKIVLSTLDNKRVIFINQASKNEFVIVKE